MKKMFFALAFLFGFLNIHAQTIGGEVSPVIIHPDGTGWSPTGSGGFGGSGSGMNGYEPNEGNLQIYTIDLPGKPLQQIVSKNGKLYVISGRDINGVWIVSAQEVKQAGQNFSNLTFNKNLGSFEDFAAKANSITWCKEWIETEESKVGINGSVKGDAGTPVVRGGVEVGGNYSRSNGTQKKNTVCATQEQ